eukprot:Awhi_evm1s2138
MKPKLINSNCGLKTVLSIFHSCLLLDSDLEILESWFPHLIELAAEELKAKIDNNAVSDLDLDADVDYIDKLNGSPTLL